MARKRYTTHTALIASPDIDAGLLETLEKGSLVRLNFFCKNDFDDNCVEVYAFDDFGRESNKLIGYVIKEGSATCEGLGDEIRSNKFIKDTLIAHGLNSDSVVVGRLVERNDYLSSNGYMARWTMDVVAYVREKEVKTVPTYRVLVTGANIQNTAKALVINAIKQATDDGTEVDCPCDIRKDSTGVYRVYKADDATTSAGEVDKDNSDKDGYDALENWLNTHASIRVYPKELHKLPNDRGNHYFVDFQCVSTSDDEFLPFVDAALARGVDTEANLMEKLHIMMDNNFGAPSVKEIFSKMLPYRKENRIPRPKRWFVSGDHNLEDATIMIANGLHVRFVGEKGSGKGTLIETACYLLNMDYVKFSCNGNITRDDLIGGLRFKDGETKFVVSEVVAGATAKYGCVINLDEINSAPAEVLKVMNTFTDDSRAIDCIEEMGILKMSPLTSVVCTLNEGYRGTDLLDEAFCDRCDLIETTQVTDLATLFKEYNSGHVAICQSVMNSMRDNLGIDLDSEDMTIRGFEDTLRLSEIIPIQRALLRCVVKSQAVENRDKVRELITSIVPATAV